MALQHNKLAQNICSQAYVYIMTMLECCQCLVNNVHQITGSLGTTVHADTLALSYYVRSTLEIIIILSPIILMIYCIKIEQLDYLNSTCISYIHYHGEVLLY